MKDVLVTQKNGAVCVAIGPEGGIEEEEVDWFTNNGFVSIALGLSPFLFGGEAEIEARRGQAGLFGERLVEGGARVGGDERRPRRRPAPRRNRRAWRRFSPFQPQRLRERR